MARNPRSRRQTNPNDKTLIAAGGITAGVLGGGAVVAAVLMGPHFIQDMSDVQHQVNTTPVASPSTTLVSPTESNASSGTFAPPASASPDAHGGFDNGVQPNDVKPNKHDAEKKDSSSQSSHKEHNESQNGHRSDQTYDQHGVTQYHEQGVAGKQTRAQGATGEAQVRWFDGSGRLVTDQAALTPGQKIYSSDGRQRLVVWGDTLSQISVETGVSVNAIALHNGIPNPNLIYAGSVLEIPAV